MNYKKFAAIAGTCMVLSGFAAGAVMLSGDAAASTKASLAPLSKDSAPKPAQSKTVVHVKLAEESGIRARGGKLLLVNTTKAPTDIAALQSLLDSYGVRKLDRLIKTDEAKLDRDQQELSARSGRKLKNLNTWLRVELTSDKAAELASKLKKLRAIENAYPEPKAAVTVGPNLVGNQRYRNPAPGGVDSIFAAGTTIPGATGENVTVADIELGWNRTHEDISKLTAAPALTPECGTEIEHGTAVMSIIAADANEFGVTGIAPDANLMTASTCVISAPGAIDAARQSLSAGDIINIEIAYNYVSPEGVVGEQVPIEYKQAEYDAISAATAAGMIVTEASGNAGANLDDPKFEGIFTTSRPNSGAIMVGAGNPSTEHQQANGYFYEENGAERSRMELSSYGSRLDMQGWGYLVTSAGYGYANNPDGTTPPDSWYTNEFAGTSSATAIVAGAAASASSAFEAHNGRPPTPQELKDLLKQTGTPQNTTIGNVLPGNIGPLPNLRAALNQIAGIIENSAPTTPTGLVAAVGFDNEVTLEWNASTDDVAVTAYDIYRNGTLLASKNVSDAGFEYLPGKFKYIDTTAGADTSYTYGVAAVDAGAAASSQATVAAKTLLFASGFNKYGLSNWTTTLNIQLTSRPGGEADVTASSTQKQKRAAYAYKDLATAGSDIYLKAKVKVKSSGSNIVNLLASRDSTGKNIATLVRNAQGKLALANNITGATTTSTTAINLGNSYDLELRTRINGNSGISEVWVNGAKVTALTKTHKLGTANVKQVVIGDTNTNRIFETLYDNVKVDSLFIP